ncbi:MAG: biotin/lipoyl-containing protein [Candidatus Kapaibacteriota bacterium]
MELTYKGKRYITNLSNNELKIDSQNHSFALDEYTENILKITIDGKQKVVYIANDSKNVYVFIDGEQFTIQKVDETIEVDKIDDIASKDIEIIKPPMPGSIVKILVEMGQEVEEGTAILVIEAMKMEMTLYSSIKGIVTEINVGPGEQVDADKTLVLIKRKENN